MAAVSVDTAEKVTEMIRAADLSINGLVVERSYADWSLELEGLDAETTRVDVVAHTAEQATDLAARGSLRYRIPVDIAVRKKFPASAQDDRSGRITNDAIDPLVKLVEEIHELFTPNRLTDYLKAVWQDTTIVVSPDRDALREHRQFTGIVRVLFWVDKDI